MMDLILITDPSIHALVIHSSFRHSPVLTFEFSGISMDSSVKEWDLTSLELSGISMDSSVEFSGISVDSSVEEWDLTLDMQDSSGSQRYFMTRGKQDGSVFPEWRD